MFAFGFTPCYRLSLMSTYFGLDSCPYLTFFHTTSETVRRLSVSYVRRFINLAGLGRARGASKPGFGNYSCLSSRCLCFDRAFFITLSLCETTVLSRLGDFLRDFLARVGSTCARESSNRSIFGTDALRPSPIFRRRRLSASI